MSDDSEANILLTAFADEWVANRDASAVRIAREIANGTFKPLERKEKSKEKIEIEVTKVITTTISRCYHDCPYFTLDGAPSPIMICGHPDLKTGHETYTEVAIISHPDCDEGFPEECPLLCKNKK